METRRSKRALLALLAVCGLLLAACSSGSEGGSDNNSSDTTVASSDQPTDIDPTGVFKMGYNLIQTGGSNGFQLDPAKENSGDTNDPIFYLIYGRILRPTPSGDLVPDQAESTSIPDPDTIKIKLRPNQTFSDGTPFNAAAVKAGLERQLASGNQSGLTEAFFNLTSVVADDDLDLTLTIKDGKAASWHDNMLSSWKTSITTANENFEAPVGAGPMTVTSFEKEKSLELATSESYWDRDNIRVGGLELIHTDQGQEASSLAALQAGQFYLTQIAVPQLDAISGTTKSLVVPDPNLLVNMQICKTDGPLANAEVRKALNKGIDREAISEAIYSDTAEPATTLWPKGARFHDDSLDDVLAYDPTAAKQILADAGYPDGFSTDIYVLPALQLPDVAAVLKQQWAEIGVTLNIIPTPGIVNDFMTTGKPGMSLIPSVTAGIDRLNMWTGASVANVCSYNDPELTALRAQLEAVSVASDEAVDLWQQIQDITMNDALSGFVSFSSRLSAYDDSKVGDPVLFPVGTFPVPDFRVTYVKK